MVIQTRAFKWNDSGSILRDQWEVTLHDLLAHLLDIEQELILKVCLGF